MGRKKFTSVSFAAWLAATVTVLLLAGCAATAGNDAAIASWKGENIVQAIKRWGSPDERRMQGGLTAYSWVEGAEFTRAGVAQHFSQTSPSGLTVGTTTFTPAQTAYRGCTRTLYTDKDGKITTATWTGSACCEISSCSNWAKP